MVVRMNQIKHGCIFGLVLVFSITSTYSEIATASQKLVQIQTIEKQKVEASQFVDLGNQQFGVSQYLEALHSYQSALKIYRFINDLKSKEAEGAILNNIGNVYKDLGQYQKAIEYYQQSVSIFKKGELQAGVFNNLGTVYDSLGQYQKAIEYYEKSFEYYQESLSMFNSISNKNGVGSSLNNLGVSYNNLGQHQKAIQFHQLSLDIFQKIENKEGEGNSLLGLGNAHGSLGLYQKSIDYHQLSLSVFHEIDKKNGEGSSTLGLGNTYSRLGQYQKSINYYRQSLSIFTRIDNYQGIGSSLGSLGNVHLSMKEYQKAIDYFERSLSVAKLIGDYKGEGSTLNNLGNTYFSLEKYQKSIDYYQQSLNIFKKIGNSSGESNSLIGLGNAYLLLKQDKRAIEYLQNSLMTFKLNGDRDGEANVLNSLGYLLTRQKQSRLSITFFKQSINITESIRKDIKKLNKEEQQSYSNTKIGTYRVLVDLLLQQDRVMEALQVLDLLKVQDLQDFLKDVKGNERTALGVEMLPQEQKIINQYNIIQNQAIQLGRELIDLRKLPTPTTSQQQRLKEIEQIQQQVNQQLTAFLQSPSTIALTNQIQQTAAQQNTTLSSYQDLSTRIQKLGKGTALFYPLILDNRIELVLFIPNQPPIHRSIAIKQTELTTEIKTFRQQLEARNSNIENISQKLYQKLIAPIEPDLQAAKIQTIVYAPDGQMRYVPLAALHDGKQWLAEKYLVNNVTAVSLTNLEPASQQKSQVLAGAFVTGQHSFNVGDKPYEFSGLKFAGEEVSNLAQTIPNTTKLIDSEFSRTAVIPNLKTNNIIHLATHAAFVEGSPDNSFILLGNGDRISLREVADWDLPNVSLVVLSACQTALGDKLGNGIEILGFGYQLQRAKVRASIASLWTVSDGGTQELMAAFYTALKTGQISHAEALRQAQVAMITGNKTGLGKPRGLITVKLRPGIAAPANKLSHPYYWAPFIMIGNGL
jgi:CHAT domain-containing protein/Tfp pilus assembly protein PilF